MRKTTKYWLLTLSLFLAVVLVSCKDWIREDKEAFMEACMDDAQTWVNDPDKAKLYCECVLIKVMERYPNVNDALDNIETLSNDPVIRDCRIPIMK